MTLRGKFYQILQFHQDKSGIRHRVAEIKKKLLFNFKRKFSNKFLVKNFSQTLKKNYQIIRSIRTIAKSNND